MKKITKTGIYLSLAAMLALGAGKTVMAYSDNDEEIYEGEDDDGIIDFTDSQGVEYYSNEQQKEAGYVVRNFTQFYDKNNKPMVTKVVIPNQFSGTPVTAIIKGFEGHKEIEEITMGNNIRKLSGSFQGCTGLKSVKLSSDISKIPDQTFQECSSLKAIQIPKECKEIGKRAFEGCASLKTVRFEKTPKYFKVGKNAFKGTAWKNSCKWNGRQMIANGVLLDASTAGTGEKLKIKGSQVSCIAQNALANANDVTDITISKVKNIQSHSLDGSKAKKITILQPKKLGDKMFANTKNLKKIVITGNVKITKATMKSLKNPKKVTLYVDKNRVAQLKKTLPCRVCAIKSKKTAKGSVIVSKSQDGKMIEDNQGLVYQREEKGYYITEFDQKYDESFKPLHCEISIPEKLDDVDVIGVKSQDVFQYCEDITSVTMPEDIQLPRAAFMGCTNLKKVTYFEVKGLPEYYNAKLRNYLFRGCIRLEEVMLTNRFEYIGNYTFMNCSELKKMTFPKKIKYIGESAFCNAGIEEVSLNNEYQISIDDNAFANCKNLKSIMFNKVFDIGSHAFYNCTRLDKVTIKGFIDTYCYVDSSAFENTKWAEPYKRKNKPIVIKGVLINGAYVKGNVILDGRKIKQIAGLAFADNKKIKRLKINGVKIIGTGAFSYSSVTEASISGCKNMRWNLFSGCRKLKNISVSKTKKIQQEALAFIPGLKKITFGKDVSELEKNAVCYCPNLQTVRFQTKKKIVWDNDCITDTQNGTMFPGCKKLRRVYMQSEKIHHNMAWALNDKKVVIYVPKRLFNKYNDYTGYKIAVQ